jgi:hypothetical protein
LKVNTGWLRSFLCPFWNLIFFFSFILQYFFRVGIHAFFFTFLSIELSQSCA